MKNSNGANKRTQIEYDTSIWDKLPADLNQIKFSASAVVLYKALRNDGLIRDLYLLFNLLNSEYPDIFSIVDLYSSVGYRLFSAASGLKEYFIEKILFTESPFSKAAEISGAGCLYGAMEATVRSDLAHLQKLASLRSEWIKDIIFCLCKGDEVIRDAVMKLPLWADTADKGSVCSERSRNVNENEDNGVPEIKALLMNSSNWADCAAELAEFHRKCGSGIFARHRAFVWRRVPVYHGREIPGTFRNDMVIRAGDGFGQSGTDGEFEQPGIVEGFGRPGAVEGFGQPGAVEGAFVGVASPDPVKFSDLISYEQERKDVIENTLHFLDGRPANNILLYGDRGTGKSTTVKALVNEYHERGLRLIEVPKKLLGDFPLIIRQLAGRNLKFILFVDDLAFEDNEENYTALKAMLEGGVETRPGNVVIYATSNRKHLIKERFSDRAGLSSGNPDDEVRAADTMQEKLSLSDRFGMTVIFSSPDKNKYLEIVEGLARARGITADADYIRSEALKWELQYNGRSPRTARQFVDWLEARLGKKG